eukprot:Gregarina_sp_Poly_1__1124@NODE_1275_length_4520_cov_99_199192_g865_i0_p2_GENE_NODE_1275_length_4520_cov_99_199192_g865_i0NODE_1275_length_4520_cov_99_199192_g865_i0_p2_ORF_typecomplete_len119_score8_14_NODE_1275_length_4520_cov_99_199192_g865_i035563912
MKFHMKHLEPIKRLTNTERKTMPKKLVIGRSNWELLILQSNVEWGLLPLICLAASAASVGCMLRASLDVVRIFLPLNYYGTQMKRRANAGEILSNISLLVTGPTFLANLETSCENYCR